MNNEHAKTTATTQTYAAQYQILRETAERLRTGGPEDIDRLLEDFRTATKAYEFCRARIEQIQTELDAEMTRSRQPEPAVL
jgi:exonuclease VII small subunit